MQNFLTTLFPIIIIMLSGVIAYLIGIRSEKARDVFSSAVTLAAVIFYGAMLFTGRSCEYNSLYFVNLSVGGFHTLYAFITSIMWFVTTVFSTPYFKTYDERSRYYLFSLLTFGATVGVFMSASLISLFVFFEMMSFTSYVMVVHDRKPETLSAASTYLTVSVIGGMSLLAGLCIYEVVNLELGIPGKIYVAIALMLVGFGAKAGAYPLHIWLPKAHPAAPAPASALLSGVLTKAGIYGVLMITIENEHLIMVHTREPWGRALLLIGVITMLLGGILALLSVNLKRTLACSSMSQIGFIFVGIAMQNLLGEENALAAGGTVLHMVNHSMIKLVLFVCAGIVYMNLHKLNLNDIKGWGRGKPLLTILFLLGALDICGIPPFGGYISKTLLHESIVEYASTLGGISFAAVKLCEYLFLLTGGLTVAYMTKLFICIFVMKPSSETKSHPTVKLPLYCAIPLTASALVLPALGIFSGISRKIAEITAPFLKSEPLPEGLNFFSLENLSGAAISITAGALIYIFIVRKVMIKDGLYKDFSNSRVDLDECVYKPLVFKLLPAVFGGICAFLSELPVYVGRFVMRLTSFIIHAVSDLPDGIIRLMRKTAYREVAAKQPDFHSASFTSKVGLKLERISEIAGVKKEKRKNLALRFAAAVEAVRITMRKISRNLSFSMIVACIGLCAALIFLFLIN